VICADPENAPSDFTRTFWGSAPSSFFSSKKTADYEGSSHFFFDIGAGQTCFGVLRLPTRGSSRVPEGLGGVQQPSAVGDSSVTTEMFEMLKGKAAERGGASTYIGFPRGPGWLKENPFCTSRIRRIRVGG